MSPRAHRKKDEYAKAFEHVVEARRRAETMRTEKLAAVIAVPEAWLIFQKGDAKKALDLLNHSEQKLKDTDDAISLGNIESARGRIIRRTGEYSLALEHYERAIATYASRDVNHSQSRTDPGQCSLRKATAGPALAQTD